jgi:hypothetical protein
MGTHYTLDNAGRPYIYVLVHDWNKFLEFNAKRSLGCVFRIKGEGFAPVKVDHGKTYEWVSEKPVHFDPHYDVRLVDGNYRRAMQKGIQFFTPRDQETDISPVFKYPHQVLTVRDAQAVHIMQLRALVLQGKLRWMNAPENGGTGMVPIPV